MQNELFPVAIIVYVALRLLGYRAKKKGDVRTVLLVYRVLGPILLLLSLYLLIVEYKTNGWLFRILMLVLLWPGIACTFIPKWCITSCLGPEPAPGTPEARCKVANE